MRVRIKLSSDEVQRLRASAEERNNIKFRLGVRNQRYTDRLGDFQIHFQGIQTEYAVAKYLGVDIDWSITASGDDKVKDLEFGGYTIQVKSRENRPDGDLFFNNLGLFKADWAVLTIYYGEGDIEIVGVIDQDTFRNHYMVRNFGHGSRVCLDQEHLLPINVFRDLIHNNAHVAVA